MNIKQNLQSFYDTEAKKYASTRKKHRADAEYILEEIRKSWQGKNTNKKTISILEFGCGSGRLLEHLQTLKWIKINYTGIDLSNELLKIGKNQYRRTDSTSLSCTFVHDDIANYIKTCKQESFDFIIGIASFQHIPTNKERHSLMKNFYRILTYEGKLIMTNRALSKRFLKTHKKQILSSLGKYLITLGKHNFRDILVPRSSSKSKQIFYRFYHLFSLKELKGLANAGWFIIKTLDYKDKEGKTTATWVNANNSFLVAKKDIFTIP
jgi:ubiquinone/menaquinone biosynthesis C-methylase UbiE